VTTVGSWPRPASLLAAQKRKHRGELAQAAFDDIADAAVLECVRHQAEAGVDIVTDGEQRRDNFYSFVAEKLDGVRLVTLAEMLEIVEDKAAFERILQTLDVPSYAIRSPVCVGRLKRREPLALNEYRFLRAHTDRPIKVPLPGPYLLSRAMWVKEATREAYASKEEVGDDVVEILREEIRELCDAGADFIQLDEPVLTELVFTQGETVTFMCAALAARKDPAEELEYAVGLLNRVLEGLDDVRTGIHLCRGNWSRNEGVLLKGSYRPLAPTLARLNVRQFVLESATPRAGELTGLLPGAWLRSHQELGLGVVNPRTAEVETPEEIVSRVKKIVEHVSPERIFLNPDCGFGTFSNRPMNDPSIARRKLESMVIAASRLRSELAAPSDQLAGTPRAGRQVPGSSASNPSGSESRKS
jgi:5-methyltetrahydropteroyltriglutamate--homocysteine methyltransferase